MERKEAIRSAYRMTGGNNFYDGIMITCSTLSGKAVCCLVWAMNKAENDAYLEKADCLHLKNVTFRHAYEKAGFFTPPYETVSSLKARLDGMYTDVDMGNLKSMAWFVCRKAG